MIQNKAAGSGKGEITILVVDDDADIRFATSRIIQTAGYTVVAASTGRDALETARQERPDIILLDVVLPDIMGTEVCRRIKNDPFFDGTFVLLTSGMKTGSFHQSEGLDAGADGYIARPVSNRELTARINAMVRIMTTERKRAYDILKEKNIALHVLLEKREQDKHHIYHTVMDSLEKLVFPYIEKLKTGVSRQDAATIGGILETNLKQGLFPFEKSVSTVYRDFTPTEIQVADFIKSGKTSKEIAAILNSSPRSINFHRNNIRKKLHIAHTKTNLRTLLLSLS
jgi:DNA-binding response OmpR family regulator/DNA-binding CsgD family transcriptional regulator